MCLDVDEPLRRRFAEVDRQKRLRGRRLENWAFAAACAGVLLTLAGIVWVAG